MSYTAGLGMVAAAGFAMSRAPVRAASGPGTTLTPDQALAALKAGNARYVSNTEAHVSDLATRRAAVAQSQAP